LRAQECRHLCPLHPRTVLCPGRFRPRAYEPAGSDADWGVHYVKVPVSRTIIEALVRLAYLSEDLQQDVSAIQRAVQNYVADAQYLP
jgi:hypothetical protein